MEKVKDDRKSLLIRYRIDDKGCISFIDPCVDEMPAILFFDVMKAISEVQDRWNDKIYQKNN